MGEDARSSTTSRSTREPGDRRELHTPTPFASEGGVMRSCCRFLAVISLSISALASDLTVRVLDPRSAAVPGAPVELLSACSDCGIAMSNTTGQGSVHFREAPTGALRA